MYGQAGPGSFLLEFSRAQAVSEQGCGCPQDGEAPFRNLAACQELKAPFAPQSHQQFYDQADVVWVFFTNWRRRIALARWLINAAGYFCAC